MLSYVLTSALKAQLQHIQTLLAAGYVDIQSFSQGEADAIHRFARVSMVGASTRIENAVLTDAEVEWVDTILSQDASLESFARNKNKVIDKLAKDRERSIEEVAGCRDMLMLVYEQAKEMMPLTEMHIRGLHHALLRHYGKASHYIGHYKTQPNSVVEYNPITNTSRTLFKTADAGPMTEAAMADLVAWYREAIRSEPWSITVACEFVFRFLAIHPFQDGNGRLGRGLFLLALLQSPDTLLASIAPFLAIDRHVERHRAEYYLVLNRCSEGVYAPNPADYKIELFLGFMLKMLEQALADIPLHRQRYKALQELSPSAERALACFKEHPERRLHTQLLVTELGLPRRTVVNALNSLLAAGFIQRSGKGAGVQYQLVF